MYVYGEGRLIKDPLLASNNGGMFWCNWFVIIGKSEGKSSLNLM